MINHLHRDCTNGMADINPQVYAGRCSLNNMLTITFGFRTESIHHPMVGQALRLSREFMNITGPVSNLVDFVPILQRLPSNMRRRARTLHSELVNVYGGLIEEVDKKMQAGGDVQDCLVKTMLLRKEKEDLDELDITMLASAFMIGGIETVRRPCNPHCKYLHAPTDCFRNAMVHSLDPGASACPEARPRGTRPHRRSQPPSDCGGRGELALL